MGLRFGVGLAGGLAVGDLGGGMGGTSSSWSTTTRPLAVIPVFGRMSRYGNSPF